MDLMLRLMQNDDATILMLLTIVIDNYLSFKTQFI